MCDDKLRWRPYRVECTGSLLTSEVKRRRARLVLWWGTAREDLRVLPAFTHCRRCAFVLISHGNNKQAQKNYASGGGHRLPAVATRGVYPVPHLQPPHELPDGQYLNASVAQLAEHALRKRMVMGSIPIRGLGLQCRHCTFTWRCPVRSTITRASCVIRTHNLPLTERVLCQLS